MSTFKKCAPLASALAGLLFGVGCSGVSGGTGGGVTRANLAGDDPSVPQVTVKLHVETQCGTHYSPTSADDSNGVPDAIVTVNGISLQADGNGDIMFTASARTTYSFTVPGYDTDHVSTGISDAAPGTFTTYSEVQEADFAIIILEGSACPSPPTCAFSSCSGYGLGDEVCVSTAAMSNICVSPCGNSGDCPGDQSCTTNGLCSGPLS